METLSQSFTKQYCSSSDVSRTVAKDMRSFITGLGIEGAVIDLVELCTVEVVNNAYEHAYQYAENSPIGVSCVLDGHNQLVIEITNYGLSMSQEAFNQAIHNEFIEPDPDVPDSWVTSGRGFIIVAQLVDAIEYLRSGKANTFKITKRIIE